MSRDISAIRFEHSGPNGSKLVAKRCDFKGGVEIHRPCGISDAQYTQDVAVIMAYHAKNILPDVLSFGGYDTADFKVIRYGK